MSFILNQNISLQTSLNKTTTTTTATANDNTLISSSNVLLTSLNEDVDEELRRIEYYRSNPLRNYAPTRGQTILPMSSASRRSSRTSRLPSAFRELRRGDRSSTLERQFNDLAHKYKLKADLKVNLSYTEELSRKNMQDVRENSKKVYNEYCHRNITKPIDVKNVSALVAKPTPSNVLNHSNHNTTAQNMSTSINASTNPYIASMDSIHHNSMILDYYINPNRVPPTTAVATAGGSASTAAPLIEIKRVRISTLEDMVDEIKNKNRNNKYVKNVLYDNYDNKNIKYKYQQQQQQKVNEYLDISQNNFTNPQTESFLNNVHYEIDEREILPQQQPQPKSGLGNKQRNNNIKRSPLDMNGDNVDGATEGEQKQPPNTSYVATRTRTQQSALNNNFQNSSLSYVNGPSQAGTGQALELKPEEHEFTSLAISRSKTLIQGLETRPLSPSSKQRMRIQQAREKVSSLSHTEKTNLNKLTIIQPFEDTKILINLDQVPTKALNTLFNCDKDQMHQPSYLIPPVKAFGFYTSKTSLDNYLDHNKTAHANTPPSTAVHNKKTNSKLSKHNDNSSENGAIIGNLNREHLAKTAGNRKNPRDNDSTITASIITRVSPKLSSSDYHHHHNHHVKSSKYNNNNQKHRSSPTIQIFTH